MTAVLAVLAVVATLAALEWETTRLRRDLDRADTRIQQLAADNTDLNDYATTLEAIVGTPHEQPARHLKTTPTAANVIDLITHNETRRGLPNLHTWLNTGNDNGDAS